MTDSDSPSLRYLDLLAQQYPTMHQASTEIINLTAQLNLPKGTEHFLSDIHGEYEAFLHVLRNASGSIRRRIDEVFANTMSDREKRTLATIIYYPEQKLPLVLNQVEDEEEWFRLTIFRQIQLLRVISSKYTRAAVREACPVAYRTILEELLHEQERDTTRRGYYQSIIDTAIGISQGRAFVVALSTIIQRLAVAHLHIIGDIFDRGPGAHIILDRLLEHHAIDIQWGNHDIVWMGAAAGSAACMANVVRVSLRYANTETLENGYGISLIPLASFAMDVYGDDPCEQFMPRGIEDMVNAEDLDENEQRLMARMQKAISIIQFKLEGQIIQRRPHYLMNDRLLLDKIDRERGVICIQGEEYPLMDTHFPTLRSEDPYRLTAREQALVDRLCLSFQSSERLQRHVRFLYAKGNMYLVHNNHLLYHGCISMNPDGSFVELEIGGDVFSGKSYMDRVERLARQGFFSREPQKRQYGQDAMWYLWSGSRSPLFGKDKMATFERYFIDEPSLHQERMNPYYDYRDEPDTARRILEEFGLDPEQGRIINGHVPVRVKKGESPIKANGRLLVIDGGFAKAYQSKTGIAGYTLIHNSYGLLLASHEPFESTRTAIQEEKDMVPRTEILQTNYSRILVVDTDRGRAIQRKIDELKQLLEAYRSGLIKEST